MEEAQKKAEDFFERREYTRCLKLYEKIFSENKKVSGKMLLQMAFIYEGLGEYTKSLYFLSLYYYYMPDNDVLTQMINLAERYKLKGYEKSDTEAIQIFYQRYYYLITSFIILIVLYGVIYFFIREFKQKPITKPRKTAFLIALLLIFWLLNSYEKQTKGIIIQDNTYLMSAPSAGGNLVSVINKGHKVRIKKKIDIWYEIAWNGQILYVQDSQIQRIPYQE